MDEQPNRPNRNSRRSRGDAQGSPITPFNRTGKLPNLPGGTSKLPRLPERQESTAFDETPASQGAQFLVRLDPNAGPGEFNFMIEGPELTAKVAAAHVMEAEASGGIPPVLYKAVDEVLGFIYGLDQQFENQGRRPRK